MKTTKTIHTHFGGILGFGFREAESEFAKALKTRSSFITVPFVGLPTENFRPPHLFFCFPEKREEIPTNK
jgi:hypothetical protein